MTDQVAKALTFQALHERSQPFLLPNPWDAGSARILSSLGFEALGTTSLGLANMLGRGANVGAVSLAEIVENAKVIADATPLPVTADLENGGGDEPDQAAAAVRMAAAAGAVGASIEDATGQPENPIYDFPLAVERVAAAAEAARSLDFPFVLTARAENFLNGRPDIDDTIRRLQAFEQAGADVLYAPGVRDIDTIRLVTSAVRRPVNVVMGFADPDITLPQLADAGVRRVSIGGIFSRLALGAVIAAARTMKDEGRFDFVRDAVPVPELGRLFAGTTPTG